MSAPGAVDERLLERDLNWQRARDEGPYDVAILGGGINGACLYDALCRRGYRVLLLDKADFSSGTSQASGMMVWGGLLYLKDLDLFTVAKLSLDRDRMLAALSDRLTPRYFRYLPNAEDGRSPSRVWFALWVYWLMGCGRRRRPRSEREFPELALIRPGLTRGSLLYEEGFLNTSDARFVLSWIAPHRGAGQACLNYCDVTGEWHSSTRTWRLSLGDNLHGERCSVSARLIVNSAGVWTDDVNSQFGITTPFKHALSKGVYVSLDRLPQHDSLLIFELGKHGDVITLVPWGQVSMWGPTETPVGAIEEGVAPDANDLDFLIHHYNRRFKRPIGRDSIVSLRCGIRPLVVDRDAKLGAYPLSLSRRQEVVADRKRPWVSCYGGKLTGCVRMAARALREIERSLGPSASAYAMTAALVEPPSSVEWTRFPGLDLQVPSAAWCMRSEYCCTVEDYLRRRTPIAQWIPRMGMGRDSANLAAVEGVASQLAKGRVERTQTLLARYHEKVRALDCLLASQSATSADDPLWRSHATH